jgi:hypothetical protein
MNIIKNNPIWHDLQYRRDHLGKEQPDKIVLIQQFFIHSSRYRNTELKYVLKKNIECLKAELIDEFIMLNEREYTAEEMGLQEDDHKLIRQIVIGHRLKFRDVIEHVQKKQLKGYIVFSNSDIFLDKSIRNVFKTTLKEGKCWYAQLRFEAYTKRIYGPNAHAQDTWIFHSNCRIRKPKCFNFILGKLGCDNIVAYELVKQKIYVYNNPLLIQTWHLQKENKRDYDITDRLSPPYLRVLPTLK